MSIINKIRQNRKRFFTTMVIIMLSATMVNYGIYNILDFYFDTVNTVYTGVQLNIISTVIIIGIVTVLMFVLLPKENVDELFNQMDNNEKRTPEQILQDMIDEEIEKSG